jgi:hypothetical protein
MLIRFLKSNLNYLAKKKPKGLKRVRTKKKMMITVLMNQLNYQMENLCYKVVGLLEINTTISTTSKE